MTWDPGSRTARDTGPVTIQDRVAATADLLGQPHSTRSQGSERRLDGEIPSRRRFRQNLACIWVGLSGLEPLTSALSGQRSNRLSYRPARVRSADEGTIGKASRCGRASLKSVRRRRLGQRISARDAQSSARVISRPPSMVAARL